MSAKISNHASAKPTIHSVRADIKMDFEFQCAECGYQFVGTTKRLIVMRTTVERFVSLVEDARPVSADMPIGWACRGDYSFICAKCVGQERDK